MPTLEPAPQNKAQKLVRQIQILEANVNEKLERYDFTLDCLNRLDKIDVNMIALAKELSQPTATKQRKEEIVSQIQKLDIQRKEAQKGLVNDMNNLTALEKYNNNYNFAYACKKFTEVGKSLKEELDLVAKASRFADRIDVEPLDTEVAA